MILIVTVAILIFFFYYLSSFNSSKFDHKVIFILGFLLFGSVLRVIISPELNKDYYGYVNLHNFENPENFVSFLLSEPYLFLIFKFFSLFTPNKQMIFLEIYWFNFLITNVFFIWLAMRRDVAIWKKMLVFVFYYFLFGFVLLRNGPVYMLFACFFYYSFRNRKFRKILLTPFMHISALALLILLFQKSKYYLRFFFLVILVLIPILIFFVMPILSDVMAIQGSMSKADSYSKGLENISIFHKIGLVFVTIVVLITIWIYKKKVLNPILITTIIFYYIAFFINPVMGFRFSPYLFLAILLFEFDGTYNSRIVRNLNVASFLLVPYFLFTLFNTHTL